MERVQKGKQMSLLSGLSCAQHQRFWSKTQVWRQLTRARIAERIIKVKSILPIDRSSDRALCGLTAGSEAAARFNGLNVSKRRLESRHKPNALTQYPFIHQRKLRLCLSGKRVWGPLH